MHQTHTSYAIFALGFPIGRPYLQFIRLVIPTDGPGLSRCMQRVIPMRKHKAPAPLYTATDALNAHGDMRPRAKRFTVSEAERQMAALLVNIRRLEMRVAKADDVARKAHLAGILSSSQARYRELVTVYEAKGGTQIHGA